MNAAMWRRDGAVPVFLGQKWEDYVEAWRELDDAEQKVHWMFAAIAGRLVRAAGGRPEDGKRPDATAIQKFCREVGIGRQTFQRYSRTYRVFAKTCTTGGTSYFQVLSFKHHEVAARYYDPPQAVAVLAEAHEGTWSANELERQLTARMKEEQGPTPLNAEAVRRLLRATYRRLSRQFSAWPSYARKRAPEMLRRLAAQIETSLLDDDGADDLSDCLRELVTADLSDSIGEHQMQAVAI